MFKAWLAGIVHGVVVQIVAAKGETFRVFHKVKQVRVRAGELVRAVHAKRVIPNHPTAAVKASALSLQLELGGILVANRQPERILI